MLQISEKDRDVITSLIANGIHVRTPYFIVNGIVQTLQDLKPIKEKKKDKED